MKGLRVLRTAACLGILMALLSAAAGQAASPWGPNLWPNGSFEEGMNGWSVTHGGGEVANVLRLADGCAGPRGLQVVTAPDDGRNVVSPVLRLTPGWYLLSFWYRFALRGKDLPEQLVYLDRQTGAEAVDRRDSIYVYYEGIPASGAWALAFATFRLREGDTGLRLRFVAAAQAATLSLDAIQVRRLQPPPGMGVVTSVETDAYNTDRIADPQSPTRFAHRVAEGKQASGGKTGGPTRFTNPSGLYRATYRFRQEAPGHGKVLGLKVAGDGGAALDDIQSGDFSGEGYQAFSVYWLCPFGMGGGPGWDWSGKGIHRFASATLEQLQPLNARECWDMLAEGVDVVKALPPAAPLPAGALAWVAAGLYTPETGVLDAMGKQGWPYAQSYVTTVSGGGLLLAPAMPDLGALEIVVLANVPSRAIPPTGQLAIERFVEGGGTLVVLGGFYAYGHGGYQVSLLEKLLPVRVTRAFDLARVTGNLEDATGSAPKKIGGCAWVHDVAVKPGAKVLWRAGQAPAAASWTFGRGRVVAVTATVLGEPDDPWWKHAAIGALLVQDRP